MIYLYQLRGLRALARKGITKMLNTAYREIDESKVEIFEASTVYDIPTIYEDWGTEYNDGRWVIDEDAFEDAVLADIESRLEMEDLIALDDMLEVVYLRLDSKTWLALDRVWEVAEKMSEQELASWLTSELKDEYKCDTL